MAPTNVVSNVMRDAQVSKSVAPIYMPEMPPAPGTPYKPAPEVMELPKHNGSLGVQSPAEFAQVRDENTRELKRSNYWSEIANILRWCTTGMIGLSGLAIVNSAGSIWSGTAISAITLPQVGAGLALAFGSAPVWAALGGLAVLAVATVSVSQHARRLLAEKTFDVQETFVQRQAGLLADSVQKAVETTHPQAPRTAWVAQVRPGIAENLGQVARLEAHPASPTEAVR